MTPDMIEEGVVCLGIFGEKLPHHGPDALSLANRAFSEHFLVLAGHPFPVNVLIPVRKTVKIRDKVTERAETISKTLTGVVVYIHPDSSWARISTASVTFMFGVTNTMMVPSSPKSVSPYTSSPSSCGRMSGSQNTLHSFPGYRF